MWKMEQIAHDDAEFWFASKFLIMYYRQWDLTFGFFKEIFTLKKWEIFVNFEIDLHFQGHLLRKLDDQTQGDHFGENLIKSVEWCRRYSMSFLFFQVIHFPSGIWKLSRVATSIHAPHFLQTSSTLIIIHKKILNFVEPFVRKLSITVFYYTWKGEKEATFLGKI